MSLRRVRLPGADLAVWRGADGEVRVAPGHCPHLGAHLAEGGTVRGNGVQCPFHGWSFDGDGRCVEIPECSKIPMRAHLNCWDVLTDGAEILARPPLMKPTRLGPTQLGTTQLGTTRLEPTLPAHPPAAPLHSSDRYPFSPFPTSWYRIADSDELSPNQSLTRRLCGQEWTLRRSMDGTPIVASHSGELCSPTVREVNGTIYAYHDALGNGLPRFEIPALAELESSSWIRGRSLLWRARVHVQEIAENAVDMAHFPTLHGHRSVPHLDRFELGDSHFEVDFSAPRQVFGRVIQTSISATYFGLGHVISRVRSRAANLVLCMNHTPIDGDWVEMRMTYLIGRGGVLADLVLPPILRREIRAEIEHDVPIWNHKIYRDRPTLSATDGPIMPFRRWAKRFYDPATMND